MRNRHAGLCFMCGRTVEAGAGHFQRNVGRDRVRPDINAKWLLRCRPCVGKGNGTALGAHEASKEMGQ